MSDKITTENKLGIFSNPNSNINQSFKQENPLLKNIDRAVFTFSMHNLSELCFNHVFKNTS